MMSGSGAKPRCGGMSLKPVPNAVQPEVLTKYKQDCMSANTQLAETTKKLQAAKMQLDLDIQNARKWIIEAEKHVGCCILCFHLGSFKKHTKHLPVRL